jgi:hypothetical protein
MIIGFELYPFNLDPSAQTGFIFYLTDLVLNNDCFPHATST